MDKGNDPRLRLGTGAFAVSLGLLLASAFPATVGRAGVGAETLRTTGFLVLIFGAVLLRVRWTPAG